MFKGQYVDDSTEDEIAEGDVVEVTIKHPSKTIVLHFATETFDGILGDSEDLSSAFFTD